MAALQQHPGYHLGFFDALDGEPLFRGECSPEYEAGWRAYWSVRELLNDENFLATPAARRLPEDAEANRFNN